MEEPDVAELKGSTPPSGTEKDTFEKSPFNSKKFVFVMVAEGGWKAVLFTMLFTIASDLGILAWGLMMGVIIVSGFIQAGYLYGQAGIDKFVRVAKINASLGMSSPLKLPKPVRPDPEPETDSERDEE
jgi:hypothetical protein